MKRYTWMKRTNNPDELPACWIANAREEARRLAAAADIAEHLHQRGFVIAAIDPEGVLVRLTARRLQAHEVQLVVDERPDLSTGLVHIDFEWKDCIRVELKFPSAS
jgi:hypothetical protein